MSLPGNDTKDVLGPLCANLIIVREQRGDPEPGQEIQMPRRTEHQSADLAVFADLCAIITVKFTLQLN